MLSQPSSPPCCWHRRPHSTRLTLRKCTPCAPGEDITAAAFGDIHDTSDGGTPMGKGGGFGTPPSGDTWYTAWAGDDTLYVNVDDGLGFEDPGHKHVMLRNCLCMLTGNPTSRPTAFAGSTSTPARWVRPCPTASVRVCTATPRRSTNRTASSMRSGTPGSRPRTRGRRSTPPSWCVVDGKPALIGSLDIVKETLHATELMWWCLHA